MKRFLWIMGFLFLIGIGGGILAAERNVSTIDAMTYLAVGYLLLRELGRHYDES